jgi:hypothetical protein
LPYLAVGSSKRWYMCVGKSTMDDTSKLAEATHPTGVGVEIVGIDKGDRGRSCDEGRVRGVNFK